MTDNRIASAAAEALSPFSFAVYISSVRNRVVPPKSRGAENEAMLDMNVMREAATIAGESIGRRIFHVVRARLAPRLADASRALPSNCFSADETKR